MDIGLKGDMDGITAADRIRKQFEIPVIYLTAHSDPATLQRAKITDPFGYILKPFDEKELTTVIEMALYKFQMERELRERERWLSTVLTSIGDAVIATDMQGRVTFMNPVAEALTGWLQGQAVSKAADEIFQVVDQESRMPLESPVTQVLNGHSELGFTNHTLLVARDGSQTPISHNAAPIKDDQDQVAGVVLTFRDISDRLQIETDRDEQRRMLRALLDTLPDFIIFKDRDSIVRMCNESYAQYLGCEMEDVIGTNDFDRFPQELAQTFREQDRYVMETGETIMLRRFLEGYGKPRWEESIKVAGQR